MTRSINTDCQGRLFASRWNRGREPVALNPMERIAQLVVPSVMRVKPNVVDSFEESARGAGGIGSTGKH